MPASCCNKNPRHVGNTLAGIGDVMGLPCRHDLLNVSLCSACFCSEVNIRCVGRGSLPRAMRCWSLALFDASLAAAFPARCGIDLAPRLGRLLHFRKPCPVASLALCLARQCRPHLALHFGDGVSLALAAVEQKGELSMTRKDRKTTARKNPIATISCRARAMSNRLANSRVRKPLEVVWKVRHPTIRPRGGAASY
jgi:hypothetical protein